MKKLIIFTTSFIFFLVFILPFAAALFIKIIPANDQPGYFGKRSIYGALTVSQEFKSNDDNLTAIGTSLGNPNLKNQKEIVLTLFDSNGQVIRTSSLNGFSVGDGAFVKFVFEPILDSKDKKYIFTLASPGADPEQVINVFVSNSPSSWIGPAGYGKEILTNGLPIVIYFKPASHLSVVRQILTSWLSRI